MSTMFMNCIAIHGSTEKIEECFAYCGSEDNAFDLERIAPIPESFMMGQDMYIRRAVAYAYSLLSDEVKSEISPILKSKEPEYQIWGSWFDALEKELTFSDLIKSARESWEPSSSHIDCGVYTFEEYGRVGLNNILNYGCINALGWCKKHWGTAWNTDAAVCSREHAEPSLNDTGEIRFYTKHGCPYELIRSLSEKFPELDFVFRYADNNYDVGLECGCVTFKNGRKQPGEVRYVNWNWAEHREIGLKARAFADEVWRDDPKGSPYEF